MIEKKRTSQSILVADDDTGITSLLTEILEEEGYEVTGVLNAAQALDAVDTRAFDLMITDLVLPDLRGNELLKRVKNRHPAMPVILITAFGTMELALQILRQGASDFIAKPFTPDQLVLAVHRVLMQGKMTTDASLSEIRDARWTGTAGLQSQSETMRRIETLAHRAADTNANILITGESGTGKTRLARQIHTHSRRANGPFVVLNCGAIPSALLESELFGVRKGAYTDAKKDRLGLIRAADGGTLFLDEVADLPMDAQAKMLRVLERKLVRPIGAIEESDVNIRVICATHQSLEQAVMEARFRTDLYYRLHVIRLDLPPLRERPEDIEHIASAILAHLQDDTPHPLAEDAIAWMRQWHWPGNIRELSNRIERAVALGEGNVITAKDLCIGENLADPAGVKRHAFVSSSPASDEVDRAPWTPRSLNEVEREHIHRMLAYTRGNKARAAQLLGIDRRTLYRRLDEEDMPEN